jgi:exodeoxyribonuclease-3
MKRFHAHAAGLLKEKVPIILTGDYNVIPTEQDAYKPERWVTDALFQPESREAFQKLLEQGWIDALRKLHPDEPIYTYWDYSLAERRLLAGGVDREVRGWEKTSDHAPVWIELSDE